MSTSNITADLQADIDIVRTLRPETAQYFGVDGPLPMTRATCAAVYGRQSNLELQAGNNMRLDYLAATAGVAVTRRLTVPREYIIHDFESGSHMSRPGIEFIRKELIAKRRICALIIAQQDRFTREPLHFQLVKRECEDNGVALLFADGIDDSGPLSVLVRVNAAFFAQMWRQRLSEGNLGGRRAHVQKGNVRIGAAPLGYVYRRGSDGRTWYEVDGLRDGIRLEDVDLDWGSLSAVDDVLAPLSPAWLVVMMFHRYAYSGWSAARIAAWLNEAQVPPHHSKQQWHAGVVVGIVKNVVYTGHAYFNRGKMVVNPAAPSPTDYTAERKRTIYRDKPEAEWNVYSTPRLVSDRLAALILEQVTLHTKRKGASAALYPSLLRGVAVCPACLRPLTVRVQKRNSGPVLYFYCHASNHESVVVRASCDQHVYYRADAIEPAARADLLALVQHPEYLERAISNRATDSAAPIRAQVAHMQTMLAEREATRTHFISLLGERVINREEFEVAIGNLRTQVDELHAALTEQQGVLARLEEEEANWDFARAALAQARLHADATLEEFTTFIRAIRGYYVPAGEQAGWHVYGMDHRSTDVTTLTRYSLKSRGYVGVSLYLATG